MYGNTPAFESRIAKTHDLRTQYEKSCVANPRVARLCEIRFWEARALSADEKALLSNGLNLLRSEGMDIESYFDHVFGAEKAAALKSIAEQRKSIEKRNAKSAARAKLLEG